MWQVFGKEDLKRTEQEAEKERQSQAVGKDQESGPVQAGVN